MGAYLYNTPPKKVILCTVRANFRNSEHSVRHWIQGKVVLVIIQNVVSMVSERLPSPAPSAYIATSLPVTPFNPSLVELPPHLPRTTQQRNRPRGRTLNSCFHGQQDDL